MAPAPSKQELPPWGVALAGSAGALVANAFVYPLDIVKTRLQVQVKRSEKDTHIDHHGHVHYEGTLHAIQHIMQEEGMSGLFQGITGNLLGVVSTNFAYFYWYGFIRSQYHKRIAKSDAPASTVVELSLGALAGALAQIFTIPISVVTTRQQTQTRTERKSIFATAKEIVDGPDGVSGLWRGIKASMVLVVNPSITYGAYERLRTLMFPGKTALAPQEAFCKFTNGFIRCVPTNFAISTRRPLQNASNPRNPTPHHRKGRPPIQTPTTTQRQTLQILHRSHAIRHRTGWFPRPLQRNRSPAAQRFPRPGNPHDDQRARRVALCLAFPSCAQDATGAAG